MKKSFLKFTIGAAMILGIVSSFLINTSETSDLSLNNLFKTAVANAEHSSTYTCYDAENWGSGPFYGRICEKFECERDNFESFDGTGSCTVNY